MSDFFWSSCVQIFQQTVFFQTDFSYIAKLNRNYVVSYAPCSQGIFFPTINVPNHSDAFVIINGPSINIIISQSPQGTHSMDFEKLYNVFAPSYYHTEQFHCPKICAPTSHPFLSSNPWQPLIFFIFFIIFLSRNTYSWNQIVCSLFRLASSTE